ncbi:MAG: 30S ribosomal protein S24e [Candidatus Diapherotrites archaeon]|nr:30S ribosomal protein S24e [Candidatus Diapherotrites archaeon]
MKLDIKTNNRNETLKRNEVTVETEEKVTPSRAALREKLSAVLNAPQEKIIIDKIETKFGSPKATIYVKVYDSREQLRKIEAKHMLKRNFREEMEKEEKEKKEKAEKNKAAEKKSEEAPQAA